MYHNGKIIPVRLQQRPCLKTEYAYYTSRQNFIPPIIVTFTHPVQNNATGPERLPPWQSPETEPLVIKIFLQFRRFYTHQKRKYSLTTSWQCHTIRSDTFASVHLYEKPWSADFSQLTRGNSGESPELCRNGNARKGQVRLPLHG